MYRNKTRTTTCRFIDSEYDKHEKIIHFHTESEYGYRHSNLWYPCDNFNEFQIICADLRECTYWKVKFYIDNGQIISMQGIRDFGCLIQ
jgi:hypothetical protein